MYLVFGPSFMLQFLSVISALLFIINKQDRMFKIINSLLSI